MMAQLSAESADLKQALKTLASATAALDGEIVLRHDEAVLVCTYRGAEVGVEAEGRWPGIARISARFLIRIGATLDRDGVVQLAVDEDGRTFRLGSASIACSWEARGAVVTLPINATLFDVLRARVQYSPEVIRRSGLEEQIRKAEEERDDLLRRAAEALAPLGVGEEEIAALVERTPRGGEPSPGPFEPDQRRLGIDAEGDQLTLG